MDQKNKKDGNRAGFGLKIALLAIALFLLVSAIITRYVTDAVPRELFVLADIIGMVLITVVMILEIKPFIELKNTGIRNIYREKDIEIENFTKFNKMLSDNSFMYHFQPIVDARTGEIFAYEALMRSPQEVGLNPREILKYAEISQQLYSIEYYTFYNTLRIYHENPERFGGRKMFINSIPSVILAENDLTQFSKLFGDITKNTVVEILEDDEDTQESCTYFENLRKLFGCRIAIDDYGSGYSNEQKLLNNNPNYIKIDIGLINSIDSDMKKQLLVSNIIKFASQYSIKVLAEGVETIDELKKLIELGVDFIQGYCCARPKAEIIPKIDPEIKDIIIEQNIRCSKFNNDRRVYKAANGEKISLLELAIQKFGTVSVDGGSVTIVGEPNHTIEVIISVKHDAKCKINLEDVNLSAPKGACFILGKNSEVELTLSGENTLNREGIEVPAGAKLTVMGDGNLTVNGSHNCGVGIGARYDEEFGNIVFDLGGTVKVNSSGDKIACIGGGRQAEGSIIDMRRGNIDISGSGIQAIGIGSSESGFRFTGTASVKVALSGNDVVGIGCHGGFPDITISGGVTDIDVGGDRVVGIGNFESESGKILLDGGRISSFAHGKDAICVGSLSGAVEVTCCAEYIAASGQGTKAHGIGSNGTLMITGGTVRSEILAATPSWFGDDSGKNVIITGGNIVSNDMTFPLQAVNSFGEALEARDIDADRFEKRISTDKGDYLYRAAKTADVDVLRVYIPKEA